MAKRKKSYVGIEIGSKQVKMALCSGRNIQNIAIEELPEHYIMDGQIVSDAAMSEFLKQMAGKHKINCKNAALVLSESDVFTRRLNMPYMTPEQVKINLPYEFHDFITDGKGGFSYDFKILDTINDEEGKPKSIDVIATAVSKDLLENRQSILEKAGFRLKSATPMTNAFSNVISVIMDNASKDASVTAETLENAKEAEYCIVDVGHNLTTFHIFKGANYEVSREIEYGVQTLCRILSEEKHIDEFLAHGEIIENYEDCQHSPHFIDVYETIAVEIMRAINFYNFNNPGNKLDQVYFCGGGCAIEGLREAIIRETGLEGHNIMDLFDEKNQIEGLHTALAAVGAAMADEDIILNLVEPDKNALTTKSIALYSALAGVLLVAFIIYGVQMPLAENFRISDEIDDEYDQLITLQLLNKDYNTIQSQYEHFYPDYYNADEMAVKDRITVLNLIRVCLFEKGDIKSINVAESQVDLVVDNISLNDVSKAAVDLEKSDLVSYVTVQTASTGAEVKNGADGSKLTTANITIMLAGGEQ